VTSGFTADETARWDKWQQANARMSRRSGRQCQVLATTVLSAVIAWLIFVLLP
jgi:hypothetical protein